MHWNTYLVWAIFLHTGIASLLLGICNIGKIHIWLQWVFCLYVQSIYSDHHISVTGLVLIIIFVSVLLSCPGPCVHCVCPVFILAAIIPYFIITWLIFSSIVSHLYCSNVCNTHFYCHYFIVLYSGQLLWIWTCHVHHIPTSLIYWFILLRKSVFLHY